MSKRLSKGKEPENSGTRYLSSMEEEHFEWAARHRRFIGEELKAEERRKLANEIAKAFLRSGVGPQKRRRHT